MDINYDCRTCCSNEDNRSNNCDNESKGNDDGKDEMITLVMVMEY